MAKVNFHSRAARAYLPVSKTFEDPEHPGSEPLTLTIVKPGVLEQAAIQEKANAAIERWVPGPDRKVNVHPLVIQAGRPAEYLSRTLVSTIAVLEAIQVGPAEERYAFDELLDLALRCEELWNDVSGWAQEVTLGDFDAGNSSAADAASSSPPPSASTKSTPPSSSSEMPATGAPTTGSDTSAGSEPPSPNG